MSEFADENINPHRSVTAGTIRRIKMENFMCHANVVIEFGDYVNFITGQNGSGKSAILTALCVAFGSRAKSTNRAATLKDFIKTGCSYSLVQVEVKNEGDDAFKREFYGNTIIIERRITETTSTTVLKDHQGRRVSNKKQELLELIDHFNIDVDNPCVIMTQDKSREFLHSGNPKDKFKFFYKATLLQQVDELLNNIEQNLETAHVLVKDLEKSIEPKVNELTELQEKIKNMEHVEEMSQKVKEMRFKLAWSWVYDVDSKLLKVTSFIEKKKSQIPPCQAEINQRIDKIEGLRSTYANLKSQYEHMEDKNSEVKKLQEQLQDKLSEATKCMLELREEHRLKNNEIQKLMRSKNSLEQRMQDIQEQNFQNTQAEESEMQENLKALQDDVDVVEALLMRLKEEENTLLECISAKRDEIRKIADQIEAYDRKIRDTKYRIDELQKNQSNKVTAFGGDKVIQLLRVIESHHREFTRPPIGPIGSHLTLTRGDGWACAVESALGKLLNAFIVTNVKDSHLLRNCARQAQYNFLQIIIYDFSIPRYNIPDNQLPQTRHPTTLSALHSDNDTVLNVLVDKGGAERQVLVKDYDTGKSIAFEGRVSNLKEVYTAEGFKMFSRGSVQTVLPPSKWARGGRLCSSYDGQIKELQRDEICNNKELQQTRQLKRAADEELQDLQEKLRDVKRRCVSVERDFRSKTLAIDDLKRTYAAEASGLDVSVDELQEDKLRVQAEIQDKETLLDKLQMQITTANEEVSNLKCSLTKLHESANEDMNALNRAEDKFRSIGKELEGLETEKTHYEQHLNDKILHSIKQAEAKYEEYEQQRKENYEKASLICPENEIEALGGCKDNTPEQLSAQLTRMIQRLERAKDKCTESIEDLRMIYEKKQRKILHKQKTYENFRQQLQVAGGAVDSRRTKFYRNAGLMKRKLTWNFNGHLGRKGISGAIDVNYNEKTLSINVNMPHDASKKTNDTKKNADDTRGLSGGERSFSTLCFALALHQMTEAPFRAMDEFDVFMDAVSRKISLDTVVEFAKSQGSQWIFITPHDISMVKQDERVKKQQMAAPRS